MLWLTLTALLTVATQNVIPVEVLDDGDVRVVAFVNGEGPYRFLLDTGSTRSGVSAELAEALHLAEVRTTRLVTPGGSVSVPLAQAVRLALAPASPVVVEPMVLPRQQFDDDRADGILGQDVLSTLTYTIDYRARRIVLHRGGLTDASGISPDAVRLTYDLERGQPMVTIPGLGAGGTAARLVADSGADRLVLFGPARATVPASGVAVRSLGGLRPATQVVVEALTIGAQRLTAVPALMVPHRPGDEWMGDGLLPLRLFARVTFSAPDRTLIVER